MFFCEVYVLRFSNLIHVHRSVKRWSEEQIWNLLKHVRSEILYHKGCHSSGLYYSHDTESLLDKVERKLGLKSDENRKDTMTVEDLNIAAKMFLYLNVCQDLQRSWFLFYTDLLQNQSPDQMILTLSRVFKGGTASRTTISRKLFDRISSVLSLKYESVSSLLKGKLSPLIEKENLNNVEGTFLI